MCPVRTPGARPGKLLRSGHDASQSRWRGYAGRKDEAQKQYAIAAGLDLSNDDEAELTRQTQGKV